MRTALAALALIASAAHADWEHVMGPRHDGICREKDIQAGSVSKVWSADVGTGTSAIVVSRGKAYTMGNSGAQDRVVCLDASNGRQVWSHSYSAPLEPVSYEGGPNAPPTVHNGRVYALSRRGQVTCLDAGSGAVVWSHTATGVEPPTWGFSGAPTVAGDTVVLNVGPRGLGLDAASGSVRWSSGGGGAGYATPVPIPPATEDAPPQVALFASAGLFGLDARSGTPAWSFDWHTASDVNAANPTPVGSGWFISSGYNTGGALIDLASGQARAAWRNRNLCAHFSTSAFVDGHIYGVTGNSGGRCALVCLSAADGSVVWRQETGFGTLRVADEKIFFLSESGQLTVAKASSEGYKELGRHRILTGTCWSQPTITGKRLYARNGKGEVVCFNLEGGALTVDPQPPDKDVNLNY